MTRPRPSPVGRCRTEFGEPATALDLPPRALSDTVAAFNKSVVDGPFDWRVPDGKHTNGSTPPESKPGDAARRSAVSGLYGQSAAS
ncbi:hypothetical protein [Amycolatopsis alkalitolerans]|uniref:Uncharacterized protein n=1 Tax=Amycolatopsis alkalitolerans TaxID=2547244 RepID=A0A5C4LXI2_9PSEU|nr:hypothetical protein [Amycolatopsis alkalitolerans]TNC24134.1 hypothetical protein FG385_18920 [Amycolatopsis alkalitolerans]